MSFGYKFWFFFEANGYLNNFELYKGKGEGQKEPVGTSVVKRMSSNIENEKCKKHIFHFDNVFTSYSLLVNLAGRNLRSTGTGRSNHTESCSIGMTKKDGPA